MEIVLRKQGKSIVVVLPPSVLKELCLAAGQKMTLHTSPDGRIILARNRRYRLADLIAQCDRKSRPPADLVYWESATPEGREAW
ncbi:MAG: ChpB-ChpS toxin-antitoxin system antitoxin [Betaproteobacteria bacterium]|nr:ChpB-ChpS toxin-antitoxin system antitoxin [Betaproteobacteria bacterium]PWB58496.1 MAG: ChpB-ChpS toxin-antitoxin system antitoxin [Betaproteobacteria bacterium]